MTNRRRLTELEQEVLIERLESLDVAIAEAYDYPVEDLVANLRDPKANTDNEVEEADGEAVRYYLRFTSPPRTWKMLCGVSGLYTIDAKTLEVQFFAEGSRS